MMLKKSKIAVAAMLALFCVMTTSAPVLAAELAAEEPEVTITTDKVEYTGNDEIKETITVENVTDGTISNVTISGNVPEGYVSKEGKEYPAQWTASVPELEEGESTELTILFSKKDATTDNNNGSADNNTGNSNNSDTSGNTPNGDTNAPTTGDSHPVGLIFAIAMVSLAGLAFLIKSKNGKKIISAILVVAMVGSLCQIATFDVNAAESDNEEESTTLSYDGYTQVWADEFDGTTLNRDDWNVELHDPGWVNAEWQEYVDSEDNIYLEDGKLVIKPIKSVDGEGNVTYTSGRINTQNKQNFTYGIFEAKVKVPEGMGYLPAFWLMAADENVYGQWPRCGEIDIMEVMGQSTDTAHGTIHYGNPHNQSQGTYVLENGTFADEFHTFAVEWEPGKISWYIDGQLFYSENDWHSTTEGLGTVTYPAPFDQPFYIILNLAVGGSWVGYPDETTDFDNATYEVEYVRVYQKDSYDENVTKPEKEVILRDPDANGNYVVNGDFAVEEDLSDSKDWSLLLSGGAATANIETIDVVTGNKVDKHTLNAIKDITVDGEKVTLSASVTYNTTTPETKTEGELLISTTNAGTLDYSVQLVQPNLPMQKGATYELTFDAYADEARSMIVDISAPDNNWIRYLNDTKVNLTTEKQTYTYTFKMTNDDDSNGRLEFNLGNTAPISDIHLSNVTLKKTGYEEIVEDNTKGVLTDGNHVYNGSFQEGEDRMEYWDVENNQNAQISVTSLADGRRLKVVVPEGTTSANPVIISQSELALAGGSNYAYSFDFTGDAGTSVDVKIAGQTSTVDMTGATINHTGKITPAETETDMSIVFTFDEPGTYYLDNVRIIEDSLIKNGSFSAGFAGYEPFVDSAISSAVTYVVDSQSEDNAADFTINNTGTQAWQIQLKQNNVELENGQWYRLSLDAKSSVDRQLMFAIQRNGNLHNDDWTPYSGEKIVDLSSDYKNYTLEFQMTEATDLESVLSISMGAVGGTQITDQHRICIDNILLENIDAPKIEIADGENLIKNPSFESGDLTSWIDSSYGGAHTVSFVDNSIIYNITDVGTEDSHIQLKQEGLPLENGATYELSFKASSTETRKINANVMSTSYSWYGGTGVELTKDTPQDVKFQFTMNEENLNSALFISMGKIADVDTPASTITLSDFTLTKIQ